MQRVEIPLGEWLPSGPDWKNPGLLVARNVIPSPGGYKPLNSHVPVEPVAYAVRGAAGLYRQDKTPLIVFGGSTALSIYVGGTETETTGLTAIGAGEHWDFCQYNNFVIATTIANPVKYLPDINSSTAWVDLPGSPPRAKYCARVNDFVMLGNLDGFPNRIQWSAFNSPATSWAPDRLTQADFQDLPQTYGHVQRIVGGRYSIVFQERGIVRLDQVEPPVVFRVTEIERDRGCAAPFSVVTAGFVTAFLAQDGFWTTNGSEFAPIGTSRVNRWFFENVDQARIGEVYAGVDWQNESFVWAFPDVNAPAGVLNRVMFYSWAQNRWTEAALSIHSLVSTRIPGFTLEQLGAAHPDLEAVPLSLDSPFWMPRQQILGAFVPDGAGSSYGLFNGPTMEARLETGEFQPEPGRRVFVSEGWPLVNGTQSLVEMGLVSTDNANASFIGQFAPKCRGGFCPVRADGRSMRAAIRIPMGANWRDASGFQVAYRVSGAR
jgi:hypothetical protein